MRAFAIRKSFGPIYTTEESMVPTNMRQAALASADYACAMCTAIADDVIALYVPVSDASCICTCGLIVQILTQRTMYP